MLMKDWDNDENVPTLCVILFIQGVKIQQTYGYDDEAKRDKVFDTFSDEQAAKILDASTSMFLEESE